MFVPLYRLRSTNSILELAAAILDLITHFFPDKIDKLPREKSRVLLSRTWWFNLCFLHVWKQIECTIAIIDDFWR